MSLRPTWKIGLGLAALMLSSAVAGVLVGHRLARRQIEVRSNPETWNRHVSREFDRIVRPTPEQSVRIQAQLDAAVDELREIRRDTIRRGTNVIWRLVAGVEEELTPGQREAFEAMKPKAAELDLDILDVPAAVDDSPDGP